MNRFTRPQGDLYKGLLGDLHKISSPPRLKPIVTPQECVHMVVHHHHEVRACRSLIKRTLCPFNCFDTMVKIFLKILLSSLSQQGVCVVTLETTFVSVGVRASPQFSLPKRHAHGSHSNGTPSQDLPRSLSRTSVQAHKA